MCTSLHLHHLFYGTFKSRKGLRQNRRNPFPFIGFHSKSTKGNKNHSPSEMRQKAIFIRQDLRQDFDKPRPAILLELEFRNLK